MSRSTRNSLSPLKVACTCAPQNESGSLLEAAGTGGGRPERAQNPCRALRRVSSPDASTPRLCPPS